MILLLLLLLSNIVIATIVIGTHDYPDYYQAMRA